MNDTATEQADLLRRAAALCFVADLQTPELASDDAHHLVHVLRLVDGATIIAADGAGIFRTCRLVTDKPAPSTNSRGGRRDANETPVRLEVTGELQRSTASIPIAVAFGLTKGDHGDWTVQKLTELGIDVIQPLITERTIVRLGRQDLQKRAERFRRIARQAAAQSRRPNLPDIADPLPFTELVAHHPGDDVVLAEPGAPPLGPTTGLVAVGPEGGWSPSELGCGLATVGLGPTVLRAETAAIAAGVLLATRRAGMLGAR